MKVVTRRYLRAIRRPNVEAWFGWPDPRSWAIAGAIGARVRPSPAAVRDAMAVVRRGRQGGRLLATLPRAGSHLLVAALDSAYALERGGDGDYEYVSGIRLSGDPAWVPRGEVLCWPAATASVVLYARHLAGSRPLPDAPVLFGHHPISPGTVDASRSPGRPVVLVRHPMPALRSNARKRRYLTLTDDGERASGLARLYVDWFRTWTSAVERDAEGRILLVRYEDLVADPATELGRISTHWGLGLGPDAIAGAVELCTRDRMAAKTGGDRDNVRVSIGVDDSIAPELLAHMDQIVAEGLDEPFGYRLDAPSSPARPSSSAEERAEA